MALPGETEAGSAGKQPCPGIVRRAHRDDDHGRGNERLAPTLHPIGSKDPDALKIPARRAASTLTRSVRSPVLAEPAQRQKAIKKGLPNTLDMLVICVESGLGLDQALMQVSKELHTAHPEISDELAVMNLEMRAGKRRAESLHNFGARTDVDEVKKMVSVLIQADRFGTSISQTLRNFSDFMRVQMRQEIEEKAAKIGVKLVFPIFFFILPSLFVVTVGPILVKVVRDFLPNLNM